MNRPALALSGMTALLFCGALTGCRSKPPVVRQFLTMPSEFAGGLSSIERAKWVRSAKRQLPPRRELIATGHLVLPAYASELGNRINGTEVMRLSGNQPGTAGLAVHTAGHPAPVLLQSEPGRFVRSSVNVPAASGWQFDHASRTVTGTAASGAATVQCEWTGTAWTVRSAR